MTTIHHATRAKAEKLGIELNIDEKRDTVYALANDGAGLGEHRTAKNALALAELNLMLKGDYPAIRVQYDIDAEIFRILKVSDATVIAEGYSELPKLADVLEACEEAEINPEEGFEEEEGGREVVPVRYKAQYAEAGHPNTCGDWLATVLNNRFGAGKKGDRFDADGFVECLKANDVDLSGKWFSLYEEQVQKGWQGRFRMNGRQKLEMKVAERGFLMLDGKKMKAPKDELMVMWDRHPDAYEAYLEANGND